LIQAINQFKFNCLPKKSINRAVILNPSIMLGATGPVVAPAEELRPTSSKRVLRVATSASMGLLLATLAYVFSNGGAQEAALLEPGFSYTFHLYQKPARKMINPADAAGAGSAAADAANQQVQTFAQMSGKEPVSVANALSLNQRFGLSAIPRVPLSTSASVLPGVSIAMPQPTSIMQTTGYPGGWSKGFSPPPSNGWWPAAQLMASKQQAVATDASTSEEEPAEPDQQVAKTAISLPSAPSAYFMVPSSAVVGNESPFAAVHRAAMLRRNAAVRSFTSPVFRYNIGNSGAMGFTTPNGAVVAVHGMSGAGSAFGVKAGTVEGEGIVAQRAVASGVNLREVQGYAQGSDLSAGSGSEVGYGLTAGAGDAVGQGLAAESGVAQGKGISVEEGEVEGEGILIGDDGTGHGEFIGSGRGSGSDISVQDGTAQGSGLSVAEGQVSGVGLSVSQGEVRGKQLGARQGKLAGAMVTVGHGSESGVGVKVGEGSVDGEGVFVGHGRLAGQGSQYPAASYVPHVTQAPGLGFTFQ